MKANLLRSRLALMEMSQTELAKRLGISKNTMTSRLNGRSFFTLKEVERICKILQIEDPAEKQRIFLP